MATVSYGLVSLAWIYCSDLLLADLASTQAMIWLSMAKGLFFVIVTTALLVFALNAVPPARPPTSGSAWQLQPAAHRRYSRVASYLFASLATLAMLAVHHALTAATSHNTLPMLLMLPIVASGWLGGLGPGLLATAIAALGLDFMGLPPVDSLRISQNHDLLQLTILVFNGIGISLLSELLIRTLKRLRAQRALLDAVVSGSPDAICVKDRQGHYQLLNQAAASLLGRPASWILGRNDEAFLPGEQASRQMSEDQSLMEQERTVSHEEQITTHDGRSLQLLVTKGPVRDANGQVSGLFSVSRDITARKRTEAALLASEAAMRTAQRLANIGNWEWDIASGRQTWSEQVYRIYGLSTELPPPGYPDIRSLFSEAGWHTLEAAIQQALHGIDDYAIDIELIRRDGARRWVNIHGFRRLDHDGKVLQLYGTVQDITPRKLAELALREASVVFESSHQGIMVVSPDMRISRVNPAFTRITGYGAEEMLGHTPRVLSSGLHDQAFYQQLFASLREHGYWHGEIWNRRKNGEIYPEALTISVAHGEAGEVLHYIAVFSDISRIKAHEAELDRMAHYDPLTGLPNRRLLGDRLEQAIARTLRSGRSLAVCYLDLDDFKEVNARGGRSVGDNLLVAVSENLKQVLRSEDTLARLGDDEFVILLSEVASVEDCSATLDRILAAINLPVATLCGTISVSASIGVCVYPDDNVDAGQLLRHADQAMYLAKGSGKNRYHLFDPNSDRKAQARRELLERTRAALRNDEFVLHYQPKVELQEGAFVGVEALVRWECPGQGLLPPAAFLPAIQGSDMDRLLGEWVIRTALAQAAAWYAEGRPTVISVNVSPSQLLDESFPDWLGDSLRRYPELPVACLELEILESVAIDDMNLAIEALQRCRALGIHFALDDFGTGYSSLTYLRQLPVDVLKVDQTFVRDMLQDSDDQGIVEGVIRLAEAFNREVVAEGVETLEHARALRRMGCRYGQGYGIARPMPASELPRWQEEWRQRCAALREDQAALPHAASRS